MNHYSIPELQKRFEKELFKTSLKKAPKELYQPINYLLKIGGKRIRPALLLAACNLFSKNIKAAYPAAIGIELFHNFTLMHDDIMDNANLRRGKKTVHKKYNLNTAILSGDAMFALATNYINQSPEKVRDKVLAVFLQTAIEVCEGQQYDINFEKKDTVSEKEYLKMIELKTAVLLAAGLKIGALIGGAKDSEANHLYEFGRNMGIAFQLQDDLLDCFGNEKTFGKKIGGDIILNKNTYLLIKAKQLAVPTVKKELLKQKNNKNHQKKIKTVKNIYKQLGIDVLAKKEIYKYHQKGIKALSKIKSSSKNLLLEFAEQLVERKI